MNRTRKRRRAGRLERIMNLDSSEILGAGGYGIIFSSDRKAVKLLYDLNACRGLYREAKLQERARELLDGIVRVPRIYSYMDHSILVNETPYLCGIEMERIPILSEFGEPLHMLLGYNDPDDINKSWGRATEVPIGSDNPSRGFFAGPDLVEEILEADELTLEGLARIMGTALRKLLDGGILPNDLEWIYGGGGRIYLVDFGLCKFGSMNPVEFLNSSWVRRDIYIPHEGDRGHIEFLEGFLD